LFAVVLVAQGPGWLRALRPPRERGIDFFQEWASARFFADGLPVYGDLALAVQLYLHLDDVAVVVPVNGHPPPAILLALPFAFLDYPDAVLAWNLLGLTLFLASLWLVCRSLAVKLAPLPTATLLLLCNPLRQQVELGQLNFILVALLILAWFFWRGAAADVSTRSLPRMIAAGLALGSATAIKLFPGFILLVLAVRRQGALVFAGLAAVALWFGVAAFVLGPSVLGDYFHEVVPRLERGQSGWANASLTGLWFKLFDPATELEMVRPLWRSPWLARGLSVMSALAILALLSCLPTSTEQQRDRLFAAAVTGTLLVSPLTWDHYLVLLLAPIFVVARALPPVRGARMAFALALTAIWLDPHSLHHLAIGSRSHAIASPLQTLAFLSWQTYALGVVFCLAVFSRTNEDDRDGIGMEDTPTRRSA
jgi:hypothetical protein